MLSVTTTYEEIIQLVRQWSPSQRSSLVQVIVQSLTPEEKPTVGQDKNTFSIALGLLVTAPPAPTDEQVTQWLAERRLEKYD